MGQKKKKSKEERPLYEPDDGLHHRHCECNPAFALCGVSLDDAEFVEPDEVVLADQCLVCMDLLYRPCPRCGDM